MIFCEHTTRYFKMRGSRLYRDVDFSECVMLSASDQYAGEAVCGYAHKCVYAGEPVCGDALKYLRANQHAGSRGLETPQGQVAPSPKPTQRRLKTAE